MRAFQSGGIPPAGSWGDWSATAMVGAVVAGWESQQAGENLLGTAPPSACPWQQKGNLVLYWGEGGLKEKRGDIKLGFRGGKNKKNHKSFHQKHYKELPAMFWERCVGSHDIS